ncbi:carboxylesterase/lipase family protein [Prosthecomicrobium sp. N25]|uniref:carboxylesterase/lipase family protein n=1 Tax=Prosthecomicrobium sp. N25 TaxID=3129254 RepID=UPI00307705F6
MATTIRTDTPVLETTSGRIRGFAADGIHTFLGIPYGAPTGGAARFRPPRPAEPWTGVRPAIVYGAACPQAPREAGAPSERHFVEEAFLLGFNHSRYDEDCLRLNVWTPSPDVAKRPVMVWLHGGHFASGSGHDIAAFDGTSLARRGDVVVVTLNHRLNVLGHLELGWARADLAGSGNAGMLDLVLALAWVRDNIGAFGGDPDNVTIFGQSGGGAKVTTLMAMPAARGLFHRAIVQSNCALRQTGMADAERIARALFAELGIADEDPDRLAEVPYAALSRAELAVMARLAPQQNPARRNRRIRWEPVVDGRILPHHAFDPVAPQISAHVPLLVGTTLNEFTTGIGQPDIDGTSLTAVRQSLAAAYGSDADAILAHFRARHPAASPFDLLSRIYSATIREWAVIQASRHAALGGAPSWLYWFTWATPVLDGRPRAYHNAELPFVFHNADRCASATGGGADALALADRVADAWIAFARHGDPNHAGLPAWAPFADDRVTTMVFDTTCEALDNPDGPERAAAGPA